MWRPTICTLVLLVAWSFGLSAQEPVGTQTGAPNGQAPAAQKTAAATAASPSAQDLANQVNNPAAPVTFIQFRDILVPAVPGTNGVANSLQMQPVLPIGPFKSFPLVQ